MGELLGDYPSPLGFQVGAGAVLLAAQMGRLESDRNVRGHLVNGCAPNEYFSDISLVITQRRGWKLASSSIAVAAVRRKGHPVSPLGVHQRNLLNRIRYGLYRFSLRLFEGHPRGGVLFRILLVFLDLDYPGGADDRVNLRVRQCLVRHCLVRYFLLMDI